MKKFYNYTFQLVCIYILVLTIFSIFNFDIDTTKYHTMIHSVDEEKVLDSSSLLVQSIPADESIEEESINEEVEEVVEAPKTPIEIPNINIIDTSGYAVLASETINISHYGHDCVGCEGGQTAAGYYVGDGRTYYNDSTFGSVKVVAADRKYPLGTILRLNYYGHSQTAIVLDYGGAIGDHGRFQIDILASSEAEASRLGTIYGASLEVLRYGYSG